MYCLFPPQKNDLGSLDVNDQWCQKYPSINAHIRHGSAPSTQLPPISYYRSKPTAVARFFHP